MDPAVIRIGPERATVYPEGGMSFDYYSREAKRARGRGWLVLTAPTPELLRAALAIRAALWPHLPAHSLDNSEGRGRI